MRAGAAGKCYHALALLGAGEVKLVFWALDGNRKRNILITYACIQIVTINTECAVGE